MIGGVDNAPAAAPKSSPDAAFADVFARALPSSAGLLGDAGLVAQAGPSVRRGEIWRSDAETLLRGALPKGFEHLRVRLPDLTVGSGVNTQAPSKSDIDAANALWNWTTVGQLDGAAAMFRRYLEANGKTWTLPSGDVDRALSDFVKQSAMSTDRLGRRTYLSDPLKEQAQDIEQAIRAQIARTGSPAGMIEGVTGWEPAATKENQNRLGTFGLALAYKLEYAADAQGRIAVKGSAVPLICDLYDFEEGGQLPTGLPTIGIDDDFKRRFSNKNGELTDAAAAHLAVVGRAMPFHVVGAGTPRPVSATLGGGGRLEIR